MAPIAVQTSPKRVVALDSDTLTGMFGYLSGRVDPVYSKSLGYPSNLALALPGGGAPAEAYFDSVRKQLEGVDEEVSVVFMGLGGDLRYSFNALLSYMTMPALLRQELKRRLPNEGIGDVLFHFVDKNGVITALEDLSSQLACSIGLDRLHALAANPAVPVVALVADAYKIFVLRLALEKRYVNSLITTEGIANLLCLHASQQSNENLTRTYTPLGGRLRFC